MGNKRKKWMHNEYITHTERASSISFILVVLISIGCVYIGMGIPTLCVIYFMLSLTQSVYLLIITKLTIREIISIETSNKIVFIADLIFYSKLLITFDLLIGMFK